MENGGDNDWGVWEYTPIESSKEYYVSQTDYEGDFGIADVLSPVEGSTGNDRFYVMALNNFTTDSYSKFSWYWNASLDNIISYSTNDFCEGYINTGYLIDKWNNSSYGKQTSEDIWKSMQTEYSDGWFMPSKSEWAAFGDACGITSSNLKEYGLSDSYWTSSQYSTDEVYTISFYYGYLSKWGVNHDNNVRLSITF